MVKTKSFGDLVLFENLSLGISEGDRIGLIARNGSGKTTLLNIIMGIEGKDEGTIVWRNDLRVEYLSQDPQFPSDITVGEVCRCVRRGNEWVVDETKDRQEVLTNSSELTRILSRLDITDLEQKVGQLSGGQQKRLALAHVLIDNPQLLILDEPTNHLDLEMVEWLEDYLNRSRSMTLLMVTHDRYFLDRVCNRIVELADKQLYTYRGNYNYYLEKRAERISAQQAQVDMHRTCYARNWTGCAVSPRHADTRAVRASRHSTNSSNAPRHAMRSSACDCRHAAPTSVRRSSWQST